MNAQRNPMLAFLMSFLVAGWGLMYVGRLKWALVVVGLLYGGITLAGLLSLIASPIGLYVAGAFIVLVKLTSAWMAGALAEKVSESEPRPSAVTHLLYALPIVALTYVLIFTLRSSVLGYALYYIPSGSMVPTLSIGDYIVADTHYDTPKVGDIVVYRYKGIEATKRVAAVAGDTLAIVNGEVINNGRNLGLLGAPAERVKRDYSLTLAPLKVEEGHVYLLGDNRDGSNDSRFIGQVPVSELTGKVTGIWYSADQERTGTNFE